MLFYLIPSRVSRGYIYLCLCCRGGMKENAKIQTINGNMQTIIKQKSQKKTVVYQKRSQTRQTVLRNSFQMKLF